MTARLSCNQRKTGGHIPPTMMPGNKTRVLVQSPPPALSIADAQPGPHGAVAQWAGGPKECIPTHERRGIERIEPWTGERGSHSLLTPLWGSAHSQFSQRSRAGLHSFWPLASWATRPSRRGYILVAPLALLVSRQNAVRTFCTKLNKAILLLHPSVPVISGSYW